MQAQPVLHKFLMNTCPTIHTVRRQSLEANVLAALTGQCLTVTALGRAMPSAVKQKHCIKRADRLLSNGHLQSECLTIYRAIAVRLIGGRQRPIILIDWSDMDDSKRHFLLRASVPVAGSSQTLYEEVHDNGTKEKPATHRRFLMRLQAMLPEACRPILVTDAGFRTPWFNLVASYGRDWIGRIRHRHHAALPGTDGWFAAKDLYAQATNTEKHLGEYQLTKRQPVACQLVLYRGKAKGRVRKNRSGERSRSAQSLQQAAREKEPWLLATSLAPCFQLAKNVARLYRLRMQIEESFRALKSERFGLGMNAHLTYQTKRLQVLVLIATLALLVVWLLGKMTENQGRHRDYQANSIKNRRVLSTIFLGLTVMHDWRIAFTVNEVNIAWLNLDECIQQLCIIG
jgi:hypothetical protein